MSKIHSTAVIEDGATIAPDVEIGPFCVVGSEVSLAAGVRLHSHVVVSGKTQVGEGTEIYPFASIGHSPQDLKYKGERSELIIGRHNVIREHVTMNPGTEGGGMVTRVGDRCLFMMASHVAHDCQIGNQVILANNAALAGHVTVGDHAIIGGLAAIHQFVRIGEHAFIGGMAAIENDVIPYGTAMGERASLAGLNLVGLRRRGFEREDIHALRNAYKALFEDSGGNFEERLSKVAKAYPESKTVQQVVAFLRADTSRAVCQPKRKDAA